MRPESQAPRGMHDRLPEGDRVWRRIHREAQRAFDRARFGRIDTPILEGTELFARGVGESTDIVQKQMFTFVDQGEDELTLRPEGTAPICRAYLQHGMKSLPQPVRLWYSGPFFRRERPQAGRLRQFHQIGAEVIGSDAPVVDADLILLLKEILDALHVEGLRLRIGSLGSMESREAYLAQLTGYLNRWSSDLPTEVRGQVARNPLRAFDSSDPRMVDVMTEAPAIYDSLAPDDRQHFDSVISILDQSEVGYELDRTLVRGLDYYTRTVFEFTSDQLGAQSGVAGGGRYDNLISELGGEPTPAGGWALGIERLAELVPTRLRRRKPLYVIAEDANRAVALKVADELRRAAVTVELDLGQRSIGGQLRRADKSRARFVLVVESAGELVLRDLRTRRESRMPPGPRAVRLIKSRMKRG
jgi:histidyl-tRNA synthetase